MFGSQKRISGAQDVTGSASIAPLLTGRPTPPPGENRSALDLIGSTGEIKAQPIRNPAHAFFNINSIDRYASVTQTTSQFALIDLSYNLLNANPASNFNMSLQRNLLSGYFHRLTVTDVNLQWNIPTINSQNYIFSLSVYNPDTTTVTNANVVLRQDYYTYGELATEIQDSIRTAFPADLPDMLVTWADSANGSGYRFNFSSESDVTMWFAKTLQATTVATDIIPGTSVEEATRAMKKFYTMIGITSNWIGSSQASTVIQSTPSYPTLIYTSYIDIISNKLCQYMRVKDSETAFQADTSVITRIYLTNQGTITYPVTIYKGSTGTGTQDLSTGATTNAVTNTMEDFPVGARPFVLNYTPATPKNINWTPGQSIIDFDIRVVDEFGDVVPWSQYTAFSPPATEQTYFTEFFEFQLTVLASET